MKTQQIGDRTPHNDANGRRNSPQGDGDNKLSWRITFLGHKNSERMTQRNAAGPKAPFNRILISSRMVSFPVLPTFCLEYTLQAVDTIEDN